MRMLFCNVCNRKIVVENGDDFHYSTWETPALGPYCDTCWFFVQQIGALKDRVTYLEVLLEDD
ncbi:hypothetical protein LCGC14_0208340 [marine sediment metagenome]|uniref:Uncharacterized protein n=1 Tax=marine sediment metagenome TaxID=412755 RepID=A0A0F9XJW3_9ZZZZ